MGGRNNMPKGLILLNKDFTISYCKLKKLNEELNVKKSIYALLPIFESNEMQRFLVMNTRHLITTFRKAVIAYRFRVEWFIDEPTDPMILPPVEFEPKTVIELYETLHTLSVLGYAFNVMNNDPTYGQYMILDIQEMEIRIDGTNLGDIYFHDRYSEDTLTEARYLFADEMLRKIQNIYDPINKKCRVDERIHILNDRWELTRSINDDGLYGIKLYPDSIALLDEPTYKLLKRMFYISRDAYFDIITYEKDCATAKEIKNFKNIFCDTITERSVLCTYMSRMYSPDDLIQALLYIDQLRECVRIIENVQDATDIENVGISCIFTFCNGKSYRTSYGEFPDMSFGNIEITITDCNTDRTSILSDFYKEYCRQEKILKGGFDE